MAQPKALILEWAEQGCIVPGQLRRALELAAALPDGARWRRFLDRLLLFMGATMLAASVVFFFAYNWQALGRFGKFALAEAPIVVALALVWRLGLERIAGQAALLVAALLVGALLALVGQTYQTGADTFELFAVWALFILPWALLAQSAALWMVWLALVNLACVLYFAVLPGVWGVMWAPERQLWALFLLDTAALAACELARARGLAWLSDRWPARLIATASGGLVAALAIMAILHSRESAVNIAVWAAWLGVAYVVYRHCVKDLYVLAGGALSIVVVAAAALGKFLPLREAGEFLLIGVVVLALSGLAGYWLRTVAAEAH